MEAYDELGNRYMIPKYCISKPANMAGVPSQQRQRTASQATNEDSQETDSTTNLLQESPSVTPSSSDGSVTRNRGGSQSRSRSGSGSGGKKKVKAKASRHSSGKPQTVPVPTGEPVVVKIRVSTLPKDIKMTLPASERVIDVKRRLRKEHEVSAGSITMLYSGRVLSDGTYVKNLDIPKGYIIQAIVT